MAEAVALEVPAGSDGKRVSFRNESPNAPPSQPLIDPTESRIAGKLSVTSLFHSTLWCEAYNELFS